MKRFDYMIAGLLVVVGLACLTMSGSYLIGDSISAYIKTFFQLCIWLGIPIILFGGLYFIIRIRKGGRK